ncbi:Predicted enzyme with a TIM-barrel fold [uncultured Clostridium sp.]|uniref:YggS family pyridoxal phosphate-dependent enzyme n=1 Tax=Enterocloster citroniae TaxID=358743 RepID=UPI00082126EF|nr:YggS family pyridoxal phosphate-dependent enzyme [Enterocloster citroniae]MCB7063762.1 YggS family pyridoxal phosphate-dependent enzyme [Enterocloster citroniae]SCH19528.1 Predicted enzyme with a TIM-barrel fold [uncultured Clostridium sp.]
MIKENLDQVRETINAACIRAGRRPEEVTLIAVSKTKPVPMLEEAYAAGTRDFGENKVQEILAKKPELPQDIRWHMIGHLQRNKVSQVIGNAVMIHSVDSLRLARQIEAEAAKKEVDVDILLEVNVAREESKYGFMLEEVEDAVMAIKDFPHVHIKGLMTIAPFVDNPEENRGIFKKLFEFAVDIGRKNIDNVTMDVLSMGMTGDYEVAVEEGATMVRVGTGIFGIR